MRVPLIDLDPPEERMSAMGHSLPAQFLASGMRIQSLRTHALLRRDEWEQLDAAVIDVASDVRNGIADLEVSGLTLNLGGLGVLVSQYERITDMTSASVNMAAEVDDEEDRIHYDLIGVPVPIISKSFRIDIRSLAASRQNGSGLDTTHVDAATRKVEEMAEQMLFTGSSIVQGGNVIYGYLTHPNRNTVGGGADWGTSTNIYGNVTAMIASLVGDNMYGPYRLYLHPDQYMQTLAMTASTSTPILNTLTQLPGLAPGSIKPSIYVTAGQGVLVQMSRDVVDLAVGQDTTPVEWDTKGGLVTRWKVLAAKVPRVKADAAGKSGLPISPGSDHAVTVWSLQRVLWRKEAGMPQQAYKVVGRAHRRVTMVPETVVLPNGSTTVRPQRGPDVTVPVGGIITDMTPAELTAFPDRFRVATTEEVAAWEKEKATRARPCCRLSWLRMTRPSARS